MNKSITVFRFENEECAGPYQGRGWDWTHHGPSTHPAPHEETLMTVGGSANTQSPYGMATILDTECSNILFGFKSLEQAYSWFNKIDVLFLIANEFKLQAYNVPISNVAFLSKQVMFNVKKAVKI